MAKPNTSAVASRGITSRWSGLLDELKDAGVFLDPNRVLQHLLKLVQGAAPDHAAGIFLRDEETRTIQGQVTDLFDQDMNVGEGALQGTLPSSASFVISSMPAGSRMASMPHGPGTQMVVSFRVSPRVRGALVLRSSEPNAYTDKDGEALSAFAVQVSSAIDSALIHQKVLQEGGSEAERDLVMAHEIMARLIPQKSPRIPGFEVASMNIPAKIVGGDLLDYIVLPDDHYGFLVADASGNGVPSALLMTGFRALFRGLIKIDINIRSVFRNANQQLVESTASHQFVSAFYAALDATTGRLIYVNGGHVPPLLLRPEQPARKLEMGGPVLGVLAAASYHEDSVVLRPNDVLVFYSDGLSEAESPGGEAFGEEKIIQAVEKNRGQSAEVICAALRDESEKFVGSNWRDDLTICVLKVL